MTGRHYHAGPQGHPFLHEEAGHVIDTVHTGGKVNRTLTIDAGKKKAQYATSANNCNRNKCGITKSDELLEDFEVLQFLCRVDERLKQDEQLLDRNDLDRLELLNIQASVDGCTLLSDIIDHLEMEHVKLAFRFWNASPGSASSDALRSRKNMTVF